MVLRKIYRGFINPINEEDIYYAVADLIPRLQSMKDRKEIMTISIFIWEDNLFIYYEEDSGETSPESFLKLLHPYLFKIPGGIERHWVQMMDIFHYNDPVENHHWDRKVKKQSYALLNRLKPEKYSSYIYYHFQYQEEYPSDGDKYGIIGIHENLILFYLEEPKEVEEVKISGLLESKNTPKEHWQELMKEHFLSWNDTDEHWIRIKKIVQI